MSYHLNQAIRLLRNEGPVSLIKAGTNFLRSNYTDRIRFLTQTQLNKYRNRFAYDAPADPHKLLWIDANAITHHASSFSAVETGLGAVRDGDWDRPNNTEPVADHWKHKGIRQRFEQDYNWEDTLYYQRFREKLENGSAKRIAGYDSLEAFLLDRCDFVDKLYEDINTNGYQPNSIGSPTLDAFGTGYGQSLEVLTVIGRDGTVYFQGKGKHRLAIAQILDLEIPVQVVCRHRQWQQTRDQILNELVSGTSPTVLRSEYIDCPDLNDVLPQSDL